MCLCATGPSVRAGSALPGLRCVLASERYIYPHKTKASVMALVPLSTRAEATLKALQERHAEAVLQQSAFCHELEHGEVRGWSLDVPATAEAHVLPVGNSVGDGIGCFEIQVNGQQVLQLLCEASSLQTKLGKVVEALCAPVEDELRASWWRCSPKQGCSVRTLQCATRGADGKVRFERSQVPLVPVVDSDQWVPQLSRDGFVGLYHHWDAHARRLRLYLLVSSYLQKACLEFTDMVQELGQTCTADDVAQSQELYWLRDACRRNRARLAYLICSAMQLPVCVMCDHHASDLRGTLMALATADTLFSDVQSVGGPKQRMVRVLDHCASTKDMSNGSLCVMAPWEGVWAFHGQNARPNNRFGGPYGNFYLPTHAPKLSSLPAQSAFVLTRERATVSQHGVLPKEDACVAEAHSTLGKVELSCYRRRKERKRLLNTLLAADQVQNDAYLEFNESVLQAMSDRGWARALGYTIMHPLAYFAASL